MNEAKHSDRSWGRAVGIGLGVAVLTALVMVTLLKTDVSPFPTPRSRSCCGWSSLRFSFRWWAGDSQVCMSVPS